MLLGRGGWGGGEGREGVDGWVKVIELDVFTSQDQTIQSQILRVQE